VKSHEAPAASVSVTPATKTYPPFWRRTAAIVYESLPVLAVVIASGFLFMGLVELLLGTAGVGTTTARLPRAHRIGLFVCWYAALAAYFVFFWRRGQTLPMRTWRLRLVTTDGMNVPVFRLLVRYLLSSAAWCTAIFALMWLREHPTSSLGWGCLVPVTIAWGWALFDRNNQTLYDKLAGTEMVLEPPGRRTK
jgi:uncharacterized RDD family membrane protein YckC